FFGRSDDQVKIRGNRIEPKEIEACLLENPDIDEACILPLKEQEEIQLCAYYVSKEAVPVESLKRWLFDRLPRYMVPAYFKHLKSIPLTPNGKIDKAALLQSSWVEKEQIKPIEIHQPKTEEEQVLADSLKKILAVETLGHSDDFFSLGGDSIKAIQLSAAIRSSGYELAVKDILENPEVQYMSNFIKQNIVKIEQKPIEGPVVLSPVQHWYFKHLKGHRHFNQSVLLLSQEWEKEAAEAAIKKIMDHHDALRMVFDIQPDGPIGQINLSLGQYPYSLTTAECPQDDYKTWIKEESEFLQSSLNIEKGPILQAGLFHTRAGDFLLLVIHHLVVDGVSWRILLEDFQSAYTAYKNNEKPILPEKTTSYQEWTSKLEAYGQAGIDQPEISYWQDELKKISRLPKSNYVAERKMNENRTICLYLEKSDTDSLLKQANEAYNTEINDLLLTALALASYDMWPQEQSLAVNLEGHGREDILEGINITRTVGWFTTLYPVVFELEKLTDTGAGVKYVKEKLRKIPHKGIGFGIDRYLNNRNTKHHSSYPEMSFNYMGQFGVADSNEKEAFTLSEIDRGSEVGMDCPSPFSLSIESVVMNGKMKVEFIYSTLEFEEKEITSFSRCYMNRLQEIIRHCEEKEGAEMTPSDFSSADLDSETLDQIYDLLGDLV
ncbi:non-ribosomal peptide synthetase, partial [Viridibacillus sp. YIM B01967]